MSLVQRFHFSTDLEGEYQFKLAF